MPARKEALTFDRHDMASTKRSDASLSTFNSNLHIEWAPCRRLSNQVASAGQHGAPGRSSPDQMCALDGRGLTLGQTLTSTPPHPSESLRDRRVGVPCIEEAPPPQTDFCFRLSASGAQNDSVGDGNSEVAEVTEVWVVDFSTLHRVEEEVEGLLGLGLEPALFKGMTDQLFVNS